MRDMHQVGWAATTSAVIEAARRDQAIHGAWLVRRFGRWLGHAMRHPLALAATLSHQQVRSR